ncbi:hypothetical protein RclHR1_06940006 [Rhizophagus clarus]|uniref:Uncharacterized protein n=1 Tax=Rhizophagus clarus TaxID=94130 RepID=A0A2Z6SK63_9GLOM|nr:hypothetical protein RclHR1_06940006 [Rhizophagus clarus]GES87553.1 hypothetical protein RCL_jg26444.t1 [Rhizophagus clarus]
MNVPTSAFSTSESLNSSQRLKFLEQATSLFQKKWAGLTNSSHLASLKDNFTPLEVLDHNVMLLQLQQNTHVDLGPDNPYSPHSKAQLATQFSMPP